MNSILDLTGEILPDARLSTYGGTSFALRQLGGRPALIYLWAPWDASRDKLAHLGGVGDVDTAIVTIAFDLKGPAAAARIARPTGDRFINLIDACALLSRVWGVRKLPLALGVDAEGHLREHSTELSTAFLDRVRALTARRVSGPWAPSAVKIQGAPPQVEILLQSCGNLLTRNRTADARKALEDALKLDPENEIVKRQLADQL